MKVSTAGVSLLDEPDTASESPAKKDRPVATGPKLPPEIAHPLKKGELVDLGDVDQIVAMLNDVSGALVELFAAKELANNALIQMAADQTTKTRRVSGRVHTVKIEMPARKFSSSVLKEAWNAFGSTPEAVAIREKYLKIDSIGLRLTEFEKLENTSVVGNPPLETLKKMLVDAEQPPTAAPKVTVEK